MKKITVLSLVMCMSATMLSAQYKITTRSFSETERLIMAYTEHIPQPAISEGKSLSMSLGFSYYPETQELYFLTNFIFDGIRGYKRGLAHSLLQANAMCLRCEDDMACLDYGPSAQYEIQNSPDVAILDVKSSIGSETLTEQLMQYRYDRVFFECFDWDTYNSYTVLRDFWPDHPYLVIDLDMPQIVSQLIEKLNEELAKVPEEVLQKMFESDAETTTGTGSEAVPEGAQP